MKSTADKSKFTPPPLDRSLILGSVAINIFALAMPLTILQVFDRILPNQAIETLSVLVGALVAIMLFDFVLKTIRGYLLSFDSSQHELELSESAVKRLLSTPVDKLKQEPSSTHLERLNAFESLREFYGGQGRMVMVDLPFALLFAGMVFAIGGIVILVPIALATFFIGLTLVNSYKSKNIAEAKKVHNQRRQDFVTETLLGLTSIKAMAMEPQMMQRFEALQETGGPLSYRAVLHSNLAQVISAVLSNSMMISVSTFGALLIIGGELNLGALAACSMLSGRLIQPLLAGLNVWTQWQNVSLAKKQANEILELPIKTTLLTQDRRPIDGSITLRNVSFHSEGGVSGDLNSFSLDIVPGAYLGVNGSDSATQSTMARIISGLREPTAGEVMVDGVLVGSEEWDSIRSNVSYVPQVTPLFRGSLLENLVMFRGAAAIDEARKICNSIGFSSRINGLPQGFDTPLGVGTSAELPPGMLQMVGVVRALVRKPKILLLDDATCFMDRDASAKFQEYLESKRGSMTLVINTRRSALLSMTDHQIEFNHGKVGNLPLDGCVYPGMAEDDQRADRIKDQIGSPSLSKAIAS